MFARRRRFLLGIVAFLCAVVANMSFLPWQGTAYAATNYRADADASAAVLQGWYNSTNGQFNTTGWWNSANALSSLIDYSALTGTSTYTGDIATTYSHNSSFINSYYDDNGWWGLTWVKAYDLTKNVNYLNTAKAIFTNMTGAWDSTCGGGIWWNTSKNYKNAIPNELFLALAAKLHQRTPGDSGSGSYIDWATREWTWFNATGLINSSHLINDGLDASCHNNGQTTWTYNQGVILGGLTDMASITGDNTYRTAAESIANAAIGTLIDTNGELKEPCEPGCNGDQTQFKGIFMRNLYALYQSDNQAAYQNFILHNVDILWNNARNSSNQIGQVWSGPFDSADASRQSSALDAINGAIPSSDGQGVNLALGKTATANNSCSSTETPDKAVDGSVTNDSKWCAGATNGAYWLKVDLGANFPVNNIIIRHAGAGGENTGWNTRDFNLQLSTDGSSWSTVATVSGNTASVTIHPISTTMARYVLLNITNPQTNPQYLAARIYELEVYADNQALHKTATANGSCSSSETPDKAVDGSIVNDSKWCAGATNGQYWLKIDLGANKNITDFVIFHAGAGGEGSSFNTRDFTIQLSTDNSSWTTVVSVTANTANITTHAINATAGRYVLLNITNPQTNSQYIAARIYELQVFSN